MMRQRILLDRQIFGAPIAGGWITVMRWLQSLDISAPRIAIAPAQGLALGLISPGDWLEIWR
jgi:hypothetical protein